MTPLNEVGLSTRLMNVLRNANCNTLEDAAAYSPSFWLGRVGVGGATLTELHALVQKHGLTFGEEQMLKAGTDTATEIQPPMQMANEKQLVTHDPIDPMNLIAKALQDGASIEMIEKLMGLQERWEANQARKAFEKAMAAASTEMPALVKNRAVKFGTTSYKHEDLAEVVSAIAPVLGKHGLSHRFETTTEPGRITVTCIISHAMGHSIRNSLSGPTDTSGGKNAIQSIGSSITYLSRYALKAALGLAAAHDDDGASAPADKEPVAKPDAMKRPAPPPPPDKTPPADAKLNIKQIMALEQAARAAAAKGSSEFMLFWRAHMSNQERAIITGLGAQLAQIRDAADAKLMAEAAAEAAAESGTLFDPETGETVEPPT
jgi:hypothetical protein